VILLLYTVRYIGPMTPLVVWHNYDKLNLTMITIITIPIIQYSQRLKGAAGKSAVTKKKCSNK